MKSETDNSNNHSYYLNGAYHMPVLSTTCSNSFILIPILRQRVGSAVV